MQHQSACYFSNEILLFNRGKCVKLRSEVADVCAGVVDTRVVRCCHIAGKLGFANQAEIHQFIAVEGLPGFFTAVFPLRVQALEPDFSQFRVRLCEHFIGGCHSALLVFGHAHPGNSLVIIILQAVESTELQHIAVLFEVGNLLLHFFFLFFGNACNIQLVPEGAEVSGIGAGFEGSGSCHLVIRHGGNMRAH